MLEFAWRFSHDVIKEWLKMTAAAFIVYDDVKTGSLEPFPDYVMNIMNCNAFCKKFEIRQKCFRLDLDDG